MTAPYSSSRFAYEGTETTETSIVRTGGAEDPAGQAQSRKIVTTANAQWLRPFRCAPWAIWNETTGADVTVTVYGLAITASILSDELWMDVEYLGDASSTLGKIVTTTKANVLASGVAVASDSSVWPVSALAATWDPATVTSVTLSSGDLLATSTGTSSADQGAHVAASMGRTSGKIYFEATNTSAKIAQNTGIGVGTTSSTYTGMGGSGGVTGAIIYRQSGNIYASGSNTGVSLGLIVQSSIAGVAVDLDNRKIWFRKIVSGVPGNWNNNASYDPTTNVGGITVPPGTMIPFCTFGGVSGSTDDQWLANFGASAFAGSVPSGFEAGWSGGTPTPFKLVAVLNSPQPGRPGLIHVRPKIGKASATIYLDPKIELTPASTTALMASTHKSSRYAYEGTETTETSIVRSGGTAHSRKIVTTANNQWLRPYRAEPYAVWNETVGADVTVTVYGDVIGALPLNDEIFMDVEYLGDASSTLGKIVTTTKTNVLATSASVPSDSSIWAGISAASAPLDGVASVTGAWSFSRNMLSSFSSTRYTKSSGVKINALKDQTGLAHDFTMTVDALRPEETTAFPTNILCADFDGADDYFTNSRIDTFFSNANGAMVISFILDAVTLNLPAAPKDNHIILGDNARYCGLTARNNGVGGVSLYAHNNTGSDTSVEVANQAVGTPYVVMFRHYGGRLYISVNGAENPVNSTDTFNMSNGLHIGGVSTTTYSCNMKVAEVFTTSNANQTDALNAAIVNMMAHVGVAFTPFKLVATLSSPQPGQPGLINVRIKAAKPSSTYYLDPTPVLT